MDYLEIESLIQSKKLTNIEVWQIVKEWYTTGMFAETLKDSIGFELEEICNENIGLLTLTQ